MASTTRINSKTGVIENYLPVKKYKTVFDISETSLNEISKNGWKLISVDGGIAYFEKEVYGWVEQEPVVFEVN